MRGCYAKNDSFCFSMRAASVSKTMEKSVSRQVPIGQEPERIEIAEDVYAVHCGTHYHIAFPYHPKAPEIMRSVWTAHYVPETRAWSARISRYADIEDALRKINQLLPADRDMKPKARRASAAAGQKQPARRNRVLVSVSDDVAEGSVLEIGGKHVTVEHIGVPFTADRKFARWGKAELVGKLVHYAYHRPSTEAEIEAHNLSRASEDPDFEAAL